MAGGVRARTTHLIGRFDAVQRRIIAIAGLGLAFRAGYILLAKRTVDTCGQFLCGDAFWYSASAKFLAHGHVYELSRDGGPFTPAADHPPLTTLLLAPVSFIEADATHVPQRLVMAVLGAAVVVGLGLLARRLAGDRAGTIAALVAAVNANLFMNDVLVMAETVAAACLVVLLFAAYRFIDVPSVRRAAVLGALVGLAGLARAELLLYGPVLVVPLALWARPLRWSQRLGRVAVAGAAAVAVLVPWTAYNATRFERPVALSTNDGLTLLGANCPAVYGIDDPGGIGFWNLGCTAVVDAVLPADADQSEVAAAYRDAAIEFIGDHPDRVPIVVAHRLGLGWGVIGNDQMTWLNQGEGRDSWASTLGVLTWWALVPLSVVGAVALRRRRVPIWPLVSSVVVVTITLIAFYGIVRFRLPADLAATVLGAVGIDRLLAWRTARRSRAADADRDARADGPAPAPPDDDAPPGGVPERSAGTHYPCLDAYRGIGMTMVLANHAAYATGFVFTSALGPFIARLDISVPMFFVMSGFLLFRPQAAALVAGRDLPSMRTFYTKRVLRIVPAYWVALVGLGILFGLQIASVRDWIANALLLPALGYPAEVCNASGTCHVGYGITQAWSIGVEATFYVLLPLGAWALGRLAAGRTRRGRIAVVTGGLVALYLAGVVFRVGVVVVDPSWAGQSLLWFPMYADLFAIGMGLALASVLVAEGRPLPRLAAALAERAWLCWTIAFGLYLLMTRFAPPDEPFGLNGAEYLPRQLVYGVASAIWLLPAMFGDQRAGRLRHLLASRPLAYLGAISLSFYLWHLALIEQVKAWTVPDWPARVALAANPPPDNPLAGLATFTGNFWVVATGAWVLSLLVAAVLFRWVERPALLHKPTRRPGAGGPGSAARERRPEAATA
ncbi:MAG: acyltransferase family protein [Acidimicrobiales bacterium]|nr:acyltransferase family protein [Acidimicrobiales bacterium]